MKRRYRVLVALVTVATAVGGVQPRQPMTIGTQNLTNTDSGHNVMLYQPQLVADQIVTVVDRVRAG